MTTITLTLGILAATAALMYTLKRLERRRRDRERANLRILHLYLQKLGDAERRPW